MDQGATTQNAVQLDDLYPLAKLVESFPHLFNLTTLRWQLRHRTVNGLAPAVVRIGKKLFISKSRYEQWLASRTGAI